MDLLTDLQVVDFSSGIPGAYCAKLLGDAGADVIKVESPEGDPLRRWTNQGYWSGADPDDGALFRYLHHGHRSIVAPDPPFGHGAGLDDNLAALLAGAGVLISDGHRLGADPTA